jgi:hypothetical protein
MSTTQEIEDITLRTIAILVTEAALWESQRFTPEQFSLFRTLVLDGLEVTRQVPGCEWMTRALSEILEKVERRYWFNILIGGVSCL